MNVLGRINIFVLRSVLLSMGLCAVGGCGRDKGDTEDRDGASSNDGDNDGWTLEEGDCDDDDPVVHPDGTDTPRNGLDEDCTEGDARGWSLSKADAVVVGLGEGENAGYAVAIGGDIDGDGLGDMLIGAPAGVDASPRGHAYVFLGPVEKSDVADAWLTIESDEEMSLAGQALVFVGDTDGDGRDDFAMGAPASSEVGSQGGAVYLFKGSESGKYGTSSAAATYWGVYEEVAGASLAGLGDIDGDGFADIAIGSPMVNQDEPVPGRVSLWLGPQQDVWSDADIVLNSDQNFDYAGSAVASAGDVNGDGWLDLLVGAPLSDQGGVDSGKVWLAYGPLSEGGALADVAASFIGGVASDFAGKSVGSAGDVDGDGMDDFLCGGLGDEGGRRAGLAWLVVGPEPGTHTLAEAQATFIGESAWDIAGWRVGSGLEPNTLVVSAKGHASEDRSPRGFVYLWENPSLSPDSAHVFEGEFDNDEAGGSIAMDGDVTGDGVPDLVIGAPGYSQRVSGGGAVYILAGGGTLLGL